MDDKMKQELISEEIHEADDTQWESPSFWEKVQKNRILTGRVLVAAGFALILCGLLLFAYNNSQDTKAAAASEGMMPDVHDAITQNVQKNMTEPSEEPTHVNPYDRHAVQEASEMTVVNKNGWNYIGYLSMPAIDKELPVLSEWSFHNLGMAPCRHMGSTKSDDLVICAHNYPSHFGHIKDLVQGDEIFFTDMDGVRSDYQVVTLNVIEDTDFAMVTDESLDLVLYTCTYSGQKRIMVGCQRLEETQ